MRAWRFHGVMVSTLDSESSDPSSNLGGTCTPSSFWFGFCFFPGHDFISHVLIHKVTLVHLRGICVFELSREGMPQNSVA